MRVCLIQMNVIYGRPAENQQHVIKQIERAVNEQADVIVLPEMWNTGYALSGLPNLADKNGQQTQHLLSSLAKKYQVNIVGGSVAVQQNNQFYNQMLVFDRDGKLLSQYEKVHLFGLMHEEQFITAGQRDNQFTLDGVSATGVICYDIRFPEWLRKQVAMGPQVLFVAAEWPVQRITQWRILLQARAIENQAFVVATNRVGADPDNRFGGDSLVIDPLGNILAEANDQETILTADLDFTQIKQVRGTIPVFADRRTELY